MIRGKSIDEHTANQHVSPASQCKKKVIISGKEFPLTPTLYSLMHYFAESEAISPTDTHVISCISVQVWELIVEVLQEIDYSLTQPPPKITCSNARNYLNEQLVERMDCMSLPLLNKFYRACHFLKAEKLKKCLAAYLACKVYFPYGSTNYQSLCVQLNIRNTLDSQKQKEYLERYPFIN